DHPGPGARLPRRQDRRARLSGDERPLQARGDLRGAADRRPGGQDRRRPGARADVSPSPSSPGGTAPAILARGLVKQFGPVRAVDGIDLSIARGESILLLGPNGAGKSTLLRLFATLVRPTSGSLAIDGR